VMGIRLYMYVDCLHLHDCIYNSISASISPRLEKGFGFHVVYSRIIIHLAW
jgi:hypothetical protein